MNTEDLIDTTITNLKIIGCVPKNGRLCIRKGSLSLESDDHLQTLRRWFNRDSREITIIHIRNTINNAMKLSKGLATNQIETELRTWTLNKLMQEMNNCQQGLINLKTTYNYDTSYKASIDVLSERLQANCEELHIITNKQLETK
jgi:hypothetical protein